MKSIILLSGGIDSSVMLALAHERGEELIALSFDYGQKHRIELQSAAQIAAHYHAQHITLSIDPSCLGTSPLLGSEEISTTAAYVPVRNTLFLTYATIQAERFGADKIYFGPNADDQDYPDCNPSFVEAYRHLLNWATKKESLQIETPLLSLTKREIIEEAHRLDLPLHLTWSCYNPQGTPPLPCEKCLPCQLTQPLLQESSLCL